VRKLINTIIILMIERTMTSIKYITKNNLNILYAYVIAQGPIKNKHAHMYRQTRDKPIQTKALGQQQILRAKKPLIIM
jgi:hypothetical protein